jgi:Domain of unknown function (DUF4349)
MVIAALVFSTQFTHTLSMQIRYIFIATLLWASACQQANKEASPSAAAPPAPPEGSAIAGEPQRYSSAVAKISGIDSIRQFARTAELKGRVKEVLAATLATENIALQHGGFILSSQFNEVTEQVNRSAIHADSMQETTLFHQNCRLTLRVPVGHLDTVLRQIGRLATVLEHRQVSAEEVTLNLLRQQLTRLREQAFQQELPENDPNTATEPAKLRRDSRLNADESELNRLELHDRVQFSLVTVEWRDASNIRSARIANTELPTHRGNMGYRLAKAASGGWILLGDLLITLTYLWPVWLLLGAVWGLRHWWKTRK